MNKNICKICGAALVIGLFALSSIGSAAVPQGQGQQVYHAGDYYEGSSYTVPSEWGWDSDETLPFPVPSGPILKPQLVITRIKIERIDNYARFTIRIRNIGETIGSGPSVAKVTVFKLGIPVDNDEYVVPSLVRLVGKDDHSTGLISWDYTGGTVVAQKDIYDDIDEWLDPLFNIRIRHFVGNRYALQQAFSESEVLSGSIALPQI